MREKDIIDEIKEDLNQEAFFTLVKKYGKLALIFIVLAISITSVLVFIKHRNHEKQEKLSKIYYGFQSKAGAAIPEELLKEKSSIYLDLAYLDRAIYLKNQKKYQQSLDELSQIIKETKHTEIRNLSSIHAIFIILNANLIEKNKPLLDLIKSKVNVQDPFGMLLNWSLAQVELAQNHPDLASNLIKNTKDSLQSEGIKLLYDVTKNHINPR